jgi:hypothetical protein
LQKTRSTSIRKLLHNEKKQKMKKKSVNNKIKKRTKTTKTTKNEFATKKTLRKWKNMQWNFPLVFKLASKL